MEDSLKLITKKIQLNFNDKNLSIDSIDYDELEAQVDEGYILNKKPVLLKYKEDYMIVTFVISKEKGRVGFGS